MPWHCYNAACGRTNQSHKNPIVQKFPKGSIDTFKKILKASFEETFHVWLIPSAPSPEEISRGKDIETRKYLAKEWNYMR